MAEICEFHCHLVIVYVKWLLSYYFSNILTRSYQLPEMLQFCTLCQIPENIVFNFAFRL